VADRQRWDEAVALPSEASCCADSDMPGGSGQQRLCDEQTLSRPGG
jgi:hypothetical protein